MEKLTKRQAEIFTFIKASIKENGMAPTSTEIGEHFGIWPNGAWLHIKALLKKGAVTYTEGKTRSVLPVKGYRVSIK